MIPKKSRFSVYNDGFLHVCNPDTEKSDFNAVKNTTKLEDLSVVLKLAYEEMSKRDKDLDFAESQGRALTIKVRTRLHHSVTKRHQVVINNTLYAIIHLDTDLAREEMYFYLEEVRHLDERSNDNTNDNTTECTEPDQEHTDESVQQ